MHTHAHTHTGGIKVYPSLIPETSDDYFDPESPEVICVVIYIIHVLLFNVCLSCLFIYC